MLCHACIVSGVVGLGERAVRALVVRSTCESTDFWCSGSTLKRHSSNWRETRKRETRSAELKLDQSEASMHRCACRIRVCMCIPTVCFYANAYAGGSFPHHFQIYHEELKISEPPTQQHSSVRITLLVKSFRPLFWPTFLFIALLVLRIGRCCLDMSLLLTTKSPVTCRGVVPRSA